jgi:acyl-CoA synthetase (NDP forming)
MGGAKPSIFHKGLNLERLFNPRAVAVIGAAQDATTISGKPLAYLLKHDYAGRVFPVNPRHASVAGLECFPDVSVLPETPDLALITVNAARVPAALKQCGERGVPFAVVFGSGFSEAGETGAGLQRELKDIAAHYAIGIVGPNCNGLLSLPNRLFAGFPSVFNADAFRVGPISLVSQSGGLGFGIFGLIEREGLGFRNVVSVGNEAVLNLLDFLEFFVEDPGSETVIAYFESLRDARRFRRIAEHAQRSDKPIIIIKAASTAAGKKAAVAHTANLGGEEAYYEALFAQCGIIRVADVQEAADCARVFLRRKRAMGRRVAIVTTTAGAGVMAADQSARAGLEVAPLNPDSTARLARIIPNFGSLLNPIDITANIHNQPDLLRETLQIIADAQDVDSLLIINGSRDGALGARTAAEMINLDQHSAKPVTVCWFALEELAHEAYEMLASVKLPRYDTPVRAAQALGALTRFSLARRSAMADVADRALSIESKAVHELLKSQTCVLTEVQTKRVIDSYGIAITLEELVQNQAGALAAATRIGYPVALKLQSADFPHKTEASVMQLHLTSPEEVTEAYERIMNRAAYINPKARIDGLLVQEMVSGGVETIVGLTVDECFGPVVTFGIGGIFVEVYRDVVSRLAPFGRSVADEMVHAIKGYPLLAGARGKPVADIDALVDAITRVAALAVDLQMEITELDINPLVVLPKGRGIKAVDALMVRRER